jgi:glyceraldehyde 3-phosphate dehydrogenase
MTIKIAINGYGRIGRNTLRAIYEYGRYKDFKVVAINTMGDDIATHALLTRYDSVHGKFPFQVDYTDDSIIIHHEYVQNKPNGNLDFKIRNKADIIPVFHEKDPSALPWKELGVDIVFECTGVFTKKAQAQKHIDAGAKRVIISAPSADADATVVFGVNNHVISKETKIISNASCTTNCLAPIAKIINDKFGIEQGLMTTIHSYTNDQVLNDVYHDDPRRARAANLSMIPTKTGAAKSVGLVLPELKGRLDGFSMRVPTANVSVVDLCFNPSKIVTAEELNSVLKYNSENDFKNIVGYNDEPLVSIDFTHRQESAIFDATQTRVEKNIVKILAWYDNEWGFSNRLLDVAEVMAKFL